MNKKGKGISFGMLAAAIGLVAVVAVFSGFVNLEDYLAVTGPSQPRPQPINPPIGVGCDTTTTPELRLVGLDHINQGTFRTNSMDANVYINGVYNAGYHLSDDSTIDVSPQDAYKIWFKESGANTTYFGFVDSGIVPCEELYTVTANITTVGTASFVAYNDDDGLANSATDNQAIGTGEKVNLDFEIKESTADACLGSPYSTRNLLLCVDYNSTGLKRPTVKHNGAALPMRGTPSGHSSLMTASSSTANPYDNSDDSECFELPVKAICDYDKLEDLTIEIEAKASINPAIMSSDVNFQLYMPQVFQDAESGDFDFVYADEYNAAQIITPLKGAIYVS